MMMVNDQNAYKRAIFLRIDNLPPGKSWKQVKYLVGGIIHHSNVLKVKMLPLMSSIVPPFIPFQSCIVTLKSNLDSNSLNDLLLNLNTFQWDYYNLYAYTLPQPMIDMADDPASTTVNNGSHGNTPIGNAAFLYPTPPLPHAPPPSVIGGIPPIPMGLSPRRRRYYQPQFHQFSPPTANSKPLPDFGGVDSSSNGIVGTNNNSRRLRQIFNEKSFRKQMTGRGMWQLQLENFPPFLKLDTLEPISADDDRALQEKGLPLVETDQPDKYGRLRWTVLKDFIKLKCPRLLNLKETSGSSSDGLSNSNFNGSDNTREFYVGVYEDNEEQVRLKVPTDADDRLNIVKSTVYKAIVGFNDKELCDLCLENLQGQEYSLGYNLKVKHLAPYEEHQEIGKNLA